MSNELAAKRIPILPIVLLLALGTGAFVIWPLFAQKTEETAEADSDGIPNGTPAELHKFLTAKLESLKSDPPQSDGEATKRVRTIQKTAERILNAKPSDHKIRRDAVFANISTLKFFSKRPGDTAAREDLKKLLDEFRNDKDDEVYTIVHGELLQLEAIDSLGKASTQLSRVVEKTLIFVTAGKLRSRIHVGVEIAQIFEQAKHYDLAGDLYRKLVSVLKASRDSRLLMRAATLQARERRLPGNELAVLTGKTVGGQDFQWTKFRGKVVLIDFWASWCGPCLLELPNVLANYRKYHDRGFEVVGISLDQERDKLEYCIARERIPWINLFHPDPTSQHPMAVYYGADRIPFTILVDRGGKIIATNVRGPELGELLAQQFDKTPKKAPQTPTD